MNEVYFRLMQYNPLKPKHGHTSTYISMCAHAYMSISYLGHNGSCKLYPLSVVLVRKL